MKKFQRLAPVSLVATAMMLAPATGNAITNGTPDGDDHPYAGVIVTFDEQGVPLGTCSGALVSDRLLITAGHCTSGASRAEAWFGSDVADGVPENGFPREGEGSGTTYTHPGYAPENFTVRDLGVVVLDAPVPKSRYATLPRPDQLDELGPSTDTAFTTVGYGAQAVRPSTTEPAPSVRMVAHPKLNQINTPGRTGDYSMILSANAATGGTCFGDSGGPVLIKDTDVLAAVSSYSVNQNCRGTNGVYRLDREWNLGWIQGQFGQYLASS